MAEHAAKTREEEPQTVRALFRCTEVTHTKHAPNADESRRFKFQAMYDDRVPEQARYAKYTPSGELTITVDNPAVQWETGKFYYLDVVEAIDVNAQYDAS